MLGIEGLQPFRQVPAVHFGHDHVGHEQVDLAGVFLGQAHGLARRACGQHGIAQLFEHHRWPASGSLARPPPAGWSRRGPAGISAALSSAAVDGLARMPGQVDLEGRSLARFAVDVDEAVVLLDDAVDRGQAQAGALAHLLGGEERLEDVVQGLLVHAAAVVADGQQHILARAQTRHDRRSRPRRRRRFPFRW